VRLFVSVREQKDIVLLIQVQRTPIKLASTRKDVLPDQRLLRVTVCDDSIAKNNWPAYFRPNQLTERATFRRFLNQRERFEQCSHVEQNVGWEPMLSDLWPCTCQQHDQARAQTALPTIHGSVALSATRRHLSMPYALLVSRRVNHRSQATADRQSRCWSVPCCSHDAVPKESSLGSLLAVLVRQACVETNTAFNINRMTRSSRGA
jgi:hypothetical protein